MNQNAIKTVYNLLGIRSKIPDEFLRFLYLKDVWGLDQAKIGDLEGCSQSFVSKRLIAARSKIPHQDLINASAIQFTEDEIKYLQFMPRELIADTQIVAFVNDVLGLEILHPFYSFTNRDVNVRVAALFALGVQNKRLMQIYGKSQAGISMTVKRNIERAMEIKRESRYDNTAIFKIMPKKQTNKFISAGGIY